MNNGRIFIQTLIVSVAGFGIILMAIFHLKEAINEKNRDNYVLENQARQLAILKGKWDNKGEIKKKVDLWGTHPKTVKNEYKGGRQIIEFGNLDPDELNDLTKDILNTPIVVKKFAIRRTNAYFAGLIVEFDR